MEHLLPSFLEPLPQLLAEVFGSNAVLASWRVLNQHRDYCVLLVQMEQPSCEVIVKLAGPSSVMEAAFERTVLIHKLITTHTSIPVADIVAVETNYTRFPWRYLIQARISGMVWADVVPKLEAKQRLSAYQQIGHAVAQMHSIRFPAFGEIASDKGEVSFIDALMQRAERTIQQKRLHDAFVEVVKERDEIFESVNQAVLCHDDLHHFNILFRNDRGNWKLVGILDFDKAWAGHSETDLARLDFWDDMTDEGFRMAYEATHSLEPSYEQRRPVYQLLWCLEYAASTPRHIKDLKRLCEELSIPPIVL